jgi:transcription antitermination factor NusG
MKILAFAAPRHEFAIADYINSTGGIASAPRHVELIRAQGNKPAEAREIARWPGYIFVNISEADWHRLTKRRLVIPSRHTDATTGEVTTRQKSVNPPVMIREIGTTQWAMVQALLELAEAEYQVNMGAIERQLAEGKARPKLVTPKRGDLIQILDGLFAGMTATVTDNGQAVVNGLEIMGRPVRVSAASGMAAE